MFLNALSCSYLWFNWGVMCPFIHSHLWGEGVVLEARVCVSFDPRANVRHDDVWHVFSPQVLYKNLGVDMKDVKPTQLLKGRVRDVESNPDFSNKDYAIQHPQQPAAVTESQSTLSAAATPVPQVINPMPFSCRPVRKALARKGFPCLEQVMSSEEGWADHYILRNEVKMKNEDKLRTFSLRLWWGNEF